MGMFTTKMYKTNLIKMINLKICILNTCCSNNIKDKLHFHPLEQ